MSGRIFTVACLFALSLNANASYFSLAGLVDQSGNFSVTSDGITLTIDNPHPGSLINYPDGLDGLDFGDGTFLGSKYSLQSFDISFNQTVSLASLKSPFTLGLVTYSITGAGVSSTGNTLSSSVDMFNGGPLLLQAGERCTFTTSATGSGSIGNIQSFSASAVPVPPAAWLFGSALLGLGATKRNNKYATKRQATM